MKKLTAIMILLTLVLTFVGCEAAPNEQPSKQPSEQEKETASNIHIDVLPTAVQKIIDGFWGTEYEVTEYHLAPETDQRYENEIVNTYVLELKSADNVYVFEFDSEEDAEQHAGYYNKDGSQYNSPSISMCIDYIAPVRMWRCEECIIEYAHSDNDMYLPLCEIFGAPFVGKTSVVEKIETSDIQYIRTDGEELNNVIVMIDSHDELMDYYSENKDRFYLERQEKVYSDTTIGFLDACDVYTPEWFESHKLALVILTEGSGSIKHKITSVTIRNYDLESFNKEDYTLQINVQRFSPEVQTCDMATWHIMIGLPRREYPEITAVGINELWDTDFLWTGNLGS